MSLEELSEREDTRFGLLPFDLFALEKWDYNTPSSEEESKRQWEQLAWEYQRLTSFQRWPYLEPFVRAVRPAPASKELTERILGSNQTTPERKISAWNFCSGWNAPLWLRTCYDPALAAKYEELEATADVTGYMVDRVLDDEALYAFEDGDDSDSWRRVLVRIPAFTEFVGAGPLNAEGTNFQYNSGMTNEDILEQIEAIPEETFRELARISLQVQAVLYLVDRETITSVLIKVLWLNEHGEAVWDNRIEPGGLEELTLWLQDAQRLGEIVDGNTNRGALLLI